MGRVPIPAAMHAMGPFAAPEPVAVIVATEPGWPLTHEAVAALSVEPGAAVGDGPAACQTRSLAM